jgi:signal transduction histidine kinase
LEAHAETWSQARTESSLRRIRRSVRQLLDLIERTLAGEKATTLNQAPSREPHDLARLIGNCAHSLRELYPQAHIKLDLKAAPRLVIDAGLMEGAMTNLIGNAIKYSDGPAEIEITAVEDRHGVTITVRDHGIGIPAEQRSAVFEEFFRGANVGNRAGTGLGLAIVKRAVESHGGQVELAKVTGRGTAFRVHLPRTIFA